MYTLYIIMCVVINKVDLIFHHFVCLTSKNPHNIKFKEEKHCRSFDMCTLQNIRGKYSTYFQTISICPCNLEGFLLPFGKCRNDPWILGIHIWELKVEDIVVRKTYTTPCLLLGILHEIFVLVYSANEKQFNICQKRN